MIRHDANVGARVGQGTHGTDYLSDIPRFEERRVIDDDDDDDDNQLRQGPAE